MKKLKVGDLVMYCRFHNPICRVIYVDDSTVKLATGTGDIIDAYHDEIEELKSPN